MSQGDWVHPTGEGGPGDLSRRGADLLSRLRSPLADQYELQSILGRGPVSSTVLARETKHGRLVVLKVLHPTLSAAVEGKRFLREIDTIAGLGHPHILTLIDSGEAGGLIYYVVPHVEGESLRAMLDRERQLPVDAAVTIAIDVADGLDHAHRRGIVHRDVTPRAIMVAEGHATIADFGVARAIDTAGSERLTAMGVSVGTPAYASPEQLAGEPSLDARADVYSLGCVLFEMLTGTPPLADLPVEEMLRRRLVEDPPSAMAARSTVPPALDEVVRRALARLPADRFATAAEFRDVLRRALAGSPGGVGRPSTHEREVPDGRRLAAIVCIDVVGYSRLVESDERGTLARMRLLREELIDLGVRDHSGRVVKGLGDGFLAEFPSAVDAVACAAAIQRTMGDRESDLPDEQRIRLRIGVNVGDIVAEDGDIFGDGVNVAARIEGLAEPGGIALSGSAWDQVHNKLDLVFESLGEHTVKNISRPIRVYQLRTGEETDQVDAGSSDSSTGGPGLRSLLGRFLSSRAGD
ncbi:MAG: protein kinase [marine benthic group bacterium]|jgi:class 3 adenylate cyclase|nr:protein kinase [Gemmatimonadota bacterium]